VRRISAVTTAGQLQVIPVRLDGYQPPVMPAVTTGRWRLSPRPNGIDRAAFQPIDWSVAAACSVKLRRSAPAFQRARVVDAVGHREVPKWPKAEECSGGPVRRLGQVPVMCPDVAAPADLRGASRTEEDRARGGVTIRSGVD
jgi:hypothetical protein